MTKKRVPIHPRIKKALGYPADMSDKELLADWRKRARRVCKPCWELKYCPYGRLVEHSPLLPSLLEDAKERHEYLKRCLQSGRCGSEEPLSSETREYYEQCVNDFDPEDFEPDPTGEITAMQSIGKWKDRPPTREYITRIINDMKMALESNTEGSSGPLDDARRKWFEEDVAQFDESNYPTEIPPQIAEMQCNIYGHICPVLDNARLITETTDTRLSGRYIPFQTKIRVVRRDNYTCQHCGKHLKDNQVEFDHIIPDSKGGSAEEHNIRLTCFDCNRDKSDKVTM
jgi:hypothetical protein